jgi:hypothetical protein
MLLQFVNHSVACGKRTKKASVKPGRKKTKTGDIPTPGQATPRTRLAATKEAALRARLEAEEAELRASVAMEAAEAAARAANRQLPAKLEPVPIEVQLAAPATLSGPSTRRYTHRNCCSMLKPTHMIVVNKLCTTGPLHKYVLSRRLLLGAPEPVPEGELQVVQVVPKKITPRKKQLASKIRKTCDN